MVGYKSPPVEHQFPKGMSGNPSGGPRGPRKARKANKSRKSFLDQKVGLTVDGKVRRMTRKEIIVHVATRLAQHSYDHRHKKKALRLQRILLDYKEQLDDAQAHIDRENYSYLLLDAPREANTVTSIEDAADVAGFGIKAYLACTTGRVLLETWVLEEAFANFGERRLSRDEQEAVLTATRHPKKVDWPEWWEDDLRARPKSYRASQNAMGKNYQPAKKEAPIGIRQMIAGIDARRRREDDSEHRRFIASLPPKERELWE